LIVGGGAEQGERFVEEGVNDRVHARILLRRRRICTSASRSSRHAMIHVHAFPDDMLSLTCYSLDDAVTEGSILAHPVSLRTPICLARFLSRAIVAVLVVDAVRLHGRDFVFNPHCRGAEYGGG
jgi:hypothetical protein